MSKEVLITIPKRGLRVIPPEETLTNILRAKNGEVVSWSDDEKKRLQLLLGCRILARRHPTPTDGALYMQDVDYNWRDQLLGMAKELSADIAYQWHKINANEDIAILLYGSITKGLVKRPNHPDPSNVDLCVIGNISDPEKLTLFDAIRNKRMEIQRRIKGKCPEINSPENNPGNAGVVIQRTDKLTRDKYGITRSYIAARAVSLYDPANIWKGIEAQALHAFPGRK